MSVLAEAINVIVRRSTLERKYLGGVAQYERDCPNGTFCMDAQLTRVGFMAPPDVQAFVERLTRLGLVFHDGEQFVDIAVVDEYQGPMAPCSWLQGGRHPAGFTAVWHVGADPSPMACPAGWQIGQSSKLNFVPTSQFASRLLPLAKEGALDVVLDYSTGRQLYIGRTSPNDLA
jgi:hypothetical protein